MRQARIPAGRRRRNYASLILFILLLGAGVYIFFATAAGSWLADNVVTPVFSYLETGGKQTGINDLTVTPAGPQTASASPEASAKATESVTAQEKTYYLLQSGSFENEQNAQAEALNLQARGGAGYIYQEGGKNKVILAAYRSESDAASVKDALLKNENMSTYVFPVTMQGLNFSITATNGQTQALKDAIALPEASADTLMELSGQYDKGQSVDAELKNFKSRCAAVRDGLQAAIKEDEKDQALIRLNDFISGLCEQMNKLPDDTARYSMETSSQLKYAVVWAVVHYSDFMKNLI